MAADGEPSAGPLRWHAALIGTRAAPTRQTARPTPRAGEGEQLPAPDGVAHTTVRRRHARRDATLFEPAFSGVMDGAHLAGRMSTTRSATA